MKKYFLTVTILVFSILANAETPSSDYRNLETGEKIELQSILVGENSTCLGGGLYSYTSVYTMNCANGMRLTLKWVSAPTVRVVDGKYSFYGTAVIQFFPDIKIERNVPSFSEVISFQPATLHYGKSILPQGVAININLTGISGN